MEKASPLHPWPSKTHSCEHLHEESVRDLPQLAVAWWLNKYLLPYMAADMVERMRVFVGSFSGFHLSLGGVCRRDCSLESFGSPDPIQACSFALLIGLQPLGFHMGASDQGRPQYEHQSHVMLFRGLPTPSTLNA